MTRLSNVGAGKPFAMARRAISSFEGGANTIRMRKLYLLVGMGSVGLGILGIALPLLPTVPFMILAAWCFGKSSPALEARLVNHPRYGRHILAWRERRAIARIGKIGATAAFIASVLLGLALLAWPWSMAPLGVAVIGSGWIWTRPDA